MGEKYGEIYGFSAGSNYILIVNSYASIRETFYEQGEAFNGRPKTSFHEISNLNLLGFLIAIHNFPFSNPTLLIKNNIALVCKKDFRFPMKTENSQNWLISNLAGYNVSYG